MKTPIKPFQHADPPCVLCGKHTSNKILLHFASRLDSEGKVFPNLVPVELPGCDECRMNLEEAWEQEAEGQQDRTEKVEIDLKGILARKPTPRHQLPFGINPGPAVNAEEMRVKSKGKNKERPTATAEENRQEWPKYKGTWKVYLDSTEQGTFRRYHIATFDAKDASGYDAEKNFKNANILLDLIMDGLEVERGFGTTT